MCGICGVVYHEPSRPVTEEFVERMSNSIRHRGPDDVDQLHVRGDAVAALRAKRAAEYHEYALRRHAMAGQRQQARLDVVGQRCLGDIQAQLDTTDLVASLLRP